MGNVFHGVLELFARKLEESGYTWFDFPEEAAERFVSEAIEAYAASYGETILYSNRPQQASAWTDGQNLKTYGADTAGTA